MNECTLPYTGKGVIQRIITDLCVLDITPDGLRLVELAPDVTIDHVRSTTDPEVRRPWSIGPASRGVSACRELPPLDGAQLPIRTAPGLLPPAVPGQVWMAGTTNPNMSASASWRSFAAGGYAVLNLNIHSAATQRTGIPSILPTSVSDPGR